MITRLSSCKKFQKAPLSFTDCRFVCLDHFIEHFLMEKITSTNDAHEPALEEDEKNALLTEGSGFVL